MRALAVVLVLSVCACAQKAVPAESTPLAVTASPAASPIVRAPTFGATTPPPTIAAAGGTYTVRADFVADRSGTLIDPNANSATVTITDDGPPRLARVDAIGDNLYVRFSEPMLQIGEGSGVTMTGNYVLDDGPL